MIKMNFKLLLIIIVIVLFSIPKINFGQIAPTLGATSSFAIFTASGLFSTNSEAGTHVTGDVGNNAGANSAFPPGTLVGNTHWIDGIAANAATDVATAYSDLTQGGSVIGVGLAGQILTTGVYQTGAASTLNGNITLDGQGNPGALFIIRIGGALSTSTNATVTLINSASLCNVYWQVNGQFDLGAGSVFRGTLIADGAINLLEGSSLFGRCLSIAGAINLYNNEIRFSPEASGTITGTSSVCKGQTGVPYSVPVITDATGYIWTLPAGATITAGINSNSITVDFSAIALSGDITVQGSSSCGNGIVSANYAVTVNPLPTTSLIYHF
jgi:hypothetical protein